MPQRALGRARHGGPLAGDGRGDQRRRSPLSGRPAGDIKAVAATAHGDGLYLLDQRPPAARPRHPVARQSRRRHRRPTGRQVRLFDEALALTGQVPHASAPSALLAWLKETRSGALRPHRPYPRLQGLAALLPHRHHRHRPDRGKHLLHRCPHARPIRPRPCASYGLEQLFERPAADCRFGRDRRPCHGRGCSTDRPCRRHAGCLSACTMSPPRRSASAAMPTAWSASSPAPIRSTRWSRPSRASIPAGSAATPLSPATGTTCRSRRPRRPTTTGSSTRSAGSDQDARDSDRRLDPCAAGDRDRRGAEAAVDHPLPSLSVRFALRQSRQRQLPRPARLARPRRHAEGGAGRHRLQSPHPCRRAARRLCRRRGAADRRRLAQSGLRADVRRHARTCRSPSPRPTRRRPSAPRSAPARRSAFTPRRRRPRADRGATSRDLSPDAGPQRRLRRALRPLLAALPKPSSRSGRRSSGWHAGMETRA